MVTMESTTTEKQNMKAPCQNNRKMNSDTYALRRQVIDFIYELKQHMTLPRINVRVTDSKIRGVLGVATMKGNQIWITAEAIKRSPAMMRHVVAHEIGHAVFGLAHDDKCPLMKPYVSEHETASDTEIILALTT